MTILGELSGGVQISGKSGGPRFPILYSQDFSVESSSLVNETGMSNRDLIFTRKTFSGARIVKSVRLLPPFGESFFNLRVWGPATIEGGNIVCNGHGKIRVKFSHSSGDYGIEFDSVFVQNSNYFRDTSFSYGQSTLGEHCNLQISNRLAGRNPGGFVPPSEFHSSMSVFDVRSPSRPLNPSCWASDLDFSWLARRSGSGQPFGILVSPNCVMVCKHWAFGGEANVSWTFSSPSGVEDVPSVKLSTSLPLGDHVFYRLNRRVELASPCKVLPESFFGYTAPSFYSGGPTNAPVTAVDGFALPECNACVLTGESNWSRLVPVRLSSLWSYYARPDAWRGFARNEDFLVDGGNSGSPLGLLINGEFVVLGMASVPGRNDQTTGFWRVSSRPDFLSLFSQFDVDHPATADLSEFVFFS